MIKNLLLQLPFFIKNKKGMSSFVTIVIVLLVAFLVFALMNNWNSLGFIFVDKGNEYATEALLG